MVVAAEALRVGFGFSFYGFFALAAIWMVAYFVWTRQAAARDRGRNGR
jgi:hypothetical protein